MKTKYSDFLLKRIWLRRVGLLTVAVMLSITVAANAAPLNQSVANSWDNLAAPPSTSLSRSQDVAAIGDPTITVNTLDDELNTDGDCSLPEAITAANTNAAVDACKAGVPGADTIAFGVTGTLIMSLPNFSMPTVTEDLTIAGPGAAKLIITNWTGPDAEFRLFEVNAGVTLNLQQLTITATHGIRNAGTLVVSYSTFSDNTAPANANGGAIEGGTVMIKNSMFSGNHLGVRICGAPVIYCGMGGAIYAGSVTVTNSTFSGSNDDFTLGGVIYAGPVTVTNSTFSDNGGRGGGAINAGTAMISESIFSNNSSYTRDIDSGAIYGGGAIKARAALISDSTFSNNRSYTNGGAIAIYYGDFFSVAGSTFSNNQADGDGGAIYVDASMGTELRSSHIGNSTFSGNQAGYRGGGVVIHGNADWHYESGIFFSTFFGNSADLGSAIYGEGSATGLSNTIIANGLRGNNCSGYVYDAGYNLQTGGDPGSCAGIPIADPLLGPLADNGGPTLTHALLPGSPAIDAVPLNGCDYSDQRGAYRPQDGDDDGIALCDIGAFEVGYLHRLFLPLVRR